VERSPDAILIHDGERVVFGNAAALRLAGATHPDQLIGRPVDHFLTPPHFKAVETWLTDAAGSLEFTAPVQDTLRRLDGSTVEVEVRAVAFLDDGRPAVHLVLRDITERLATEQAVRQLAERLQQAERMEAVGHLAGGVAHEVNNMMVVVLGVGAMLLQDASLGAATRADLREIVKAADRAATVTRQLLAFGRRAAHQPRTMRLGAALRGSESVLRQLLGPARRLVLAADGGPLVRIDPGQFQDLLVSLVNNARDAMAEGGTLTLVAAERTTRIAISAADGQRIPPGRYATVAVRDTGSGMDTSVQAHIFEPFFTTKPTGEGTGLGLAAAQGILTQHGGYITVASAPGAGSTFTIYLPIQRGDVAPEPARDVPEAGTIATPDGATVLVVDDEPAVLAITARSLEHGGYRVRQAKDGGDALALVDQLGPPDLLLTDLTMPGIGGVELARQIRERWPAVPILFMSGYPAEELRRQGGDAAAGDLIEKPFSPTELTARVSAALSRSLVTASAAR
jgi:hypothetical protein